MPTYLVVRRRDGPDWDPARLIREQSGWEAHASFMADLAEAGFILFGGPLAGDDRVVFAVAAESEDAVRTALARDPWSEAHLRLESVDDWSIWLTSPNAQSLG
jgi:hypothetical protein